MIFAQPRFNQFCLSVSCLVGLFVHSSTTVCAHVYEDGFVERSLTITIRDGVGYGEYQIGLNSQTADQILKSAEQLNQKNVQLKLMKQQSIAVDQLDLSKKPQPVSPTKPLDTNAALMSNKSDDSKIKAKTKIKTEATPKPPAARQELNAVEAGEHLTDLEVIKRFGDLQHLWFAGHLELSLDGRSVELSKVSVEPAARHPYSVVVKFQFLLNEKTKKAIEAKPATKDQGVSPNPVVPAGQVVDFQVADRLFSGYSGAVRYALRARGSTMLLRSNVAPVLVRAERVEIVQNTFTDQENSPAIQAKLTDGSQ